ncbi:MAG: hypothetical protein CMM96_00105 [Rickettsiales bacterium]|nr:hypothetical protein [Rickettsiales bacterium]
MKYVRIPNDAPSDSVVKIISTSKSDGEKIKKDDLIIEYETSKAIFELRSEYDGYINYFYQNDDEVEVGMPVCVINSNPIDIDELKEIKREIGIEQGKIENNKLISKKAIELIKKHNLNVDDFQTEFINEKMILDYIGKSKSEFIFPDEIFNDEDLIIYGIGGHAGMCIDVVRSQNKYNLKGFIDDNISEDSNYGLEYYGGYDNIDKLHDMGLKNIIIGMGMLNSLKMREAIYYNLKRKFTIPTIRHSSSIIENSAKIMSGSQIMAGSIIGSNVHIDENCIINSGAIVSHDSIIGKSSHITPGATIAGHVNIGERVLVGMCATIYISCNISDDKIIKNNESVIIDK